MQQHLENTHICHAVLRGKSNQQVFESEVQKKKLLDAAVSAQMDYPVQTLAYCVLDNELHLVVQSEEPKDLSAFLDSILLHYEKICLPYMDNFGFIHNEKNLRRRFRKTTVYELKNTGIKNTINCCMNLHRLPVANGVAERSEDYWWSSYQDYLGRRWLPLADTAYLTDGMGERRLARYLRNRCREEYPVKREG